MDTAEYVSSTFIACARSI